MRQPKHRLKRDCPALPKHLLCVNHCALNTLNTSSHSIVTTNQRDGYCCQHCIDESIEVWRQVLSGSQEQRWKVNPVLVLCPALPGVELHIQRNAEIFHTCSAVVQDCV